MSFFKSFTPSSEPQRKPEVEATRASLELLYHVSRELTTALDLHTVLQRVVFLAMRTVGAISGSIIVLDDNGRPVESAIITGEYVHDHTTQRLRVTLEKGLAGWVVRNRQSVLVTDTGRDDRWMQKQYEGEEATAPKSAVSAPLLVRERMVGVMTLVHPQAGFFNHDHLALVQAIADQAGIAVLNARLYAESQRQARVMTALAESAATISGSLKLEDVLQRIIEQTGQALRVQAISLALLDITSGDLVFRAASGWSNRREIGARLPFGKGIAGWVAEEGRGVILAEVVKDPHFDPEINRRTGLEARSVACAPIRYHGQVIGVLEAINPTEGVFDSGALLVLTGIGSLAGTAIRHAQLFERLQAAHQSYHQLFDDSIDPILITNWKGEIIESNRQAALITGYDKEVLAGMGIRQLHVPDEEKIGVDFEHLKSGETVSYESLLRTRQQSDLPVQVYVRQVLLEDAHYLQWILRDITERKNADLLREDLIAMIYHDLRSPLSNVISSLDMLETLWADQDVSLLSMVNIAQRAAERIQRLTNSLLDVNRLEAGQSIGRLVPTAVIDLVEGALETVLPLAESKQQQLRSSVDVKLPPVLVDADMIRRVLTNLLENAIKYTPVGCHIEVGASAADGLVQFRVQDDGPGIPVSEHERIFEKFTRLNLRQAPKGLGLGLAYCRLAVQAHGGRIWVESEPGAGARFIFTLPVAHGSSQAGISD